MPTQRYSVTPHPIETLLTWLKSGEGDICRALIEADLVDTALRDSAFLQSEAIQHVVSEAKDNMAAFPGQLFYGTQIPVCLWFLAKNKNADAKLDEHACARLHSGTASRFFAFHLN